MPLLAEGPFKFYDPRQGGDYQVETSDGRRLSLRENELLMVSFDPGRVSGKLTTPPSLSLSDFDRLIATSMHTLGKIGFFGICPLTKAVRQSGAVDVEQLDELFGSAIGYFDIDPRTIESQLDSRRRHASYAEWVIGSCEKPFVRPQRAKWYQRAIYWDTAFLFTQVQNIRCLSVFYGETGESVCFTRIHPGIDDLLRPLRSLADPPPPGRGRPAGS